MTGITTAISSVVGPPMSSAAFPGPAVCENKTRYCYRGDVRVSYRALLFFLANLTRDFALKILRSKFWSKFCDQNFDVSEAASMFDMLVLFIWLWVGRPKKYAFILSTQETYQDSVGCSLLSFRFCSSQYLIVAKFSTHLARLLVIKNRCLRFPGRM